MSWTSQSDFCSKTSQTKSSWLVSYTSLYWSQSPVCRTVSIEFSNYLPHPNYFFLFFISFFKNWNFSSFSHTKKNINVKFSLNYILSELKIRILHKEKIIEIFPILSITKLTHFGLLASCSTLYGDRGTDYTDSHHTMCDALAKSQNTLTLRHRVREKFL